MAVADHTISVKIAKELKLTKSEIAKLKKEFKADLANVIKARGRDESPISEININNPRRRPKPKTSKYAAKGKGVAAKKK